MDETIRYFRRFHGYDYSQGASLFITMTTEPRRALFGHVTASKMVHTPLGRQVNEALEAIPRLNTGVRLHTHVVMPDHLHANLYLEPGLAEPLQILGAAMRRFKTFTTTLARQQVGCDSLWQQGYHDRIGRSRRFIESIDRYIRYNPLKYELMYHRPAYLQIHEPLDSPRLDPGSFWKGQGDCSLLGVENKILALRVSRKVTDYVRVVARMEDAVRAGYTILSGFISPGERVVHEMLAKNPQARYIHILPRQMATGYRPGALDLPALAEGRFLVLAEGNDESEFCRGACLLLNDEIRKIAQAGAGLSVYWQATGPVVVSEG